MNSWVGSAPQAGSARMLPPKWLDEMYPSCGVPCISACECAVVGRWSFRAGSRSCPGVIFLEGLRSASPPPLGAAPRWAGRPEGSAVPEPISGLQARADLCGQAVEKPARVHHVGDVPAEALPYPGKVDLGQPQVGVGVGCGRTFGRYGPPALPGHALGI